MHRLPQFLPDGEHFLFYVHSREAEHRGTYVSSLAAPEAKRLILRGTQTVAYASPGYLLFAREGNLLAQRFDVDRLEGIGEPIAVGKQVAVFYGQGLFSASSNGVLAYRRPYTTDYRLAWFDRQGNQLGTLPMPGGAQSRNFLPMEANSPLNGGTQRPAPGTFGCSSCRVVLPRGSPSILLTTPIRSGPPMECDLSGS